MMFDIYVLILLFLMGLFLGRLLIVYGLKLPLKNSPVYNICEYCNDKYKWYEMIPIVSFFSSKFKCNYCNHKLNVWYLILEFILGLLFCTSYLLYGFSYEFLLFIILSMLASAIFVTDFKYYIILDSSLLVSGTIILLLKFMFFGFRTLGISVLSGIILFMFIFFIKIVGDKFFGQESLGGGDVKLVAIFGFTLGVRLSIVSLILGALFAFPFALYCAIAKKDKVIPFGPYLIFALMFVFVFMEPIKNVLSIIFNFY
jgi:prepilin signal peptidase PulO-like enzyme (type II secretory pathway)